MPAWNECGIYDEACRNKTCDHPTNPKNHAVQCRTMLSQRPCGSRGCVRPECSGARLSAEVFSASLSAPENDERTTEVQEPLYTLAHLSHAEVWALVHALRMSGLSSGDAGGSVLRKITKALGM